MSKVIIFDSSALVSLVKSDDQLHEQAQKVANELANSEYELLLPAEVLAESLNVLGRFVSRQVAHDIGQELLQQHAAGELRIVQAESAAQEAALAKLLAAPGQPSYVDCLVMALADQYKTPYVFGFDACFRKNGYRLP